MSFDSRIAHLVTHRRRLVYTWLAAIILSCVGLIIFYHPLDSEVLNLLPDGFDSVQGLKTFNRDFSQNTELTFAVYDPDNSTDMEGFTTHFAEMLKKEPWVKRVIYEVPMQSDEALNGISTLALPLLFNLPPAEFDDAIAMLQPDKMKQHILELKSRIEAGSVRHEWEFKLDPLGPVFVSLKSLGKSASTDRSLSFTSHDQTLHVVFVSTDQVGLGPRECQAMMMKVREFEKRVTDSWQGGKAPEILLTGRTPYVAEMSKGMESDIIVTLAGSVILVAGIFYFGFRRVRPLVAIMHVLLLCCIIAVAAGFLIFHGLNGIAIGFCSILVGLGVDFGMLLYGSYQSERNAGHDHESSVAAAIRKIGNGVLFGAITTAAGFLTLGLSGCSGFSQLGVLIAIGILLSAALMMTAFFMFMGPDHSPREHDWLFNKILEFTDRVFRSPAPIMVCAGILLLALNIFAFAPVKSLTFQVDPKSLQPKDSKAWHALQIISGKMTIDGVDPVLVIVKANDPETFHDNLVRLQDYWMEQKAAGKIRNVSSPAPYVVSPKQVKENITRLTNVDIPAAREELKKIMESEGFTPEAFKGSFALLDSLEAIKKGNVSLLDWSKTIPADSPWRFMLDKFLGAEPNVAVAYITPLKSVSTMEDKEELDRTLSLPGTPIHITGWNYTLASLIPWAKEKLKLLSITMIGFNVALLIFLYRKFFPLFILMLSLFLSIGAMVASLKIFNIPLNLFNVLAFPLVLGVGVDYGIYVLLAFRKGNRQHHSIATVLKPVFLSGLCTVCGFGSLVFAHNPSLSGLGVVCALGVAWCLVATMLFILPAYVWMREK
ncbi:MAG: MMPL family transporter [Chthoniobacteraceae bacterium]